MLRVLTLSTLFPTAAEPTLGVFVERQTRGLAALAETEVQVVSPIGLPVWPLSRLSHYRARARLPEREVWKGLTVHRPHFPVWPVIGHAGTATAMAEALRPLLSEVRKRFPFDIIDAEFFWPDGPAAMALSKVLDVPFSIKARGADIQYWGSRPGIGEQIVAAGRAANGLLAVSAALRDVMGSLGIPTEKIKVHYTGVDLDRFRPIDRAAAKAKLGIDGPLIVTVGALIPRKGQRLTLGALERLPSVSLILVGAGPDRKALERIVRSRRLENRVRFLGNLPHDDLPSVLSAADVMVLPSSSEGLANVWVESLACGTPIVISEVGGAREMLNGSRAGRLVPLEAEAIAAAVRDVLSRPPDPAVVRRAAGRFSWNRNALELREHLACLAGCYAHGDPNAR